PAFSVANTGSFGTPVQTSRPCGRWVVGVFQGRLITNPRHKVPAPIGTKSSSWLRRVTIATWAGACTIGVALHMDVDRYAGTSRLQLQW
ncbi:hypothetical protein, partial [Xanthomonas fragariae]|uniref:hypothetical protein n=5 Tax=Xanthomonas fragariae TaxID=48664 RepID=UPI0025A1EA89